MKTFELIEERRTQSSPKTPPPSNQDGGERNVNPKLAAIISILPGLGHLYNGETGKGLLFLAVGSLNLFIMAALIFHEPFINSLTALGKIFNLTLNERNAASLGLSKPALSSLLLYALILIGFTTFAIKDAYQQAQERLKGKRFARYYLGLAEASSGAYIVHFVLLAVFVLVSIYSATPKPPLEEIAEIELTQPEPEPPELPPPPAPHKEPAKAPEKKVIPKPEPVEKPVVAKSTEPPKQAPTPVAIATPTDAPSNLTTAPVDGAPSDSNGGAPAAGSSGNGSGDAGGAGGDGNDVDYGSYIAEMQKRIKKAWFPPKGNESKTITVKFKIKRSGDLGRIKLLVSSGMSMADEAAVEAVKNAAPFPPLPAGSPEEIEIKFTFDYSVFNGGKAFLK